MVGANNLQLIVYLNYSCIARNVLVRKELARNVSDITKNKKTKIPNANKIPDYFAHQSCLRIQTFDLKYICFNQLRIR